MRKQRLDRLERMARQLFPTAPAPEVVVFTLEERVQCLRQLMARMLCSSRKEGADPFASLEGEAYLLSFCRWFLDNAEYWPEWAKRAGFRFGLGYLFDNDLLDRNGKLTRRGEQRYAALGISPVPIEADPVESTFDEDLS